MADFKLPGGEISFYDEDSTDVIPKSVPPMIELGVTGVKRVSGYVDEEFLPALRGRNAVKVYREMSSNDSMVGALMFAIDKLIREIEWKVLPADQGQENVAAQEFLESCMEDMSDPWDGFIGEVLSMLVYGWSWHEIVYKKRMGPWQTDPRKRSKYSDGLIGWRKIPIRAQETLLRWSFDETGGVRAMIQMAPPIEKSILFRTAIAKGNPEGLSLLRTAYRSWYFKKRLEEFEAIGVERDLAGMPVGKVPADYLNAAKGTPQAKTVDAFRKMVRGVRRDENEGLVLPVQYDPDTKQPLFDFELMSSGGTRQFDTNTIISRYEQRILMSVLADFILVGHEDTGSYSLHTDKTGIFRTALNTIAKSIADTLNRYAVPRLFAVNGWKLDELPRFEPTNVDPPALDQLAAFISATAGAGMQWFPDPELEKYLREIARLPEMTDEDVDYKRAMLQQQQMTEYASGQMDLIGMQQKAEMTAQGMSPEQAQMQSETPTTEQTLRQANDEQDAEAMRRMHPVGQEDMAMQQQQMDQQNALDQAKLNPQKVDPSQEQFASAQDKRDQAAADRQERSASKQAMRDQKSGTRSDQLADRAHRRDTAKMKLQDQLAARKHKRDMEMLRHRSQTSAGKAPIKKLPAKKPPPKKGS